MKLYVIFWKSTGKCHKMYSSVTVIQLHVDSKPAAPSFIIGKQILSAAFALDSQQRRNHQNLHWRTETTLNNLYCKFYWILFTTVMTLKYKFIIYLQFLNFLLTLNNCIWCAEGMQTNMSQTGSILQTLVASPVTPWIFRCPQTPQVSITKNKNKKEILNIDI